MTVSQKSEFLCGRWFRVPRESVLRGEDMVTDDLLRLGPRNWLSVTSVVFYWLKYSPEPVLFLGEGKTNPLFSEKSDKEFVAIFHLLYQG